MILVLAEVVKNISSAVEENRKMLCFPKEGSTAFFVEQRYIERLK